ncbi:MAG: hypothetical protein OQL11_07670 [Gammaproteobacteria bacterium]|nr:hypothetical protein [Gammaproteobacteria bacterium]
MSIMSVMKRGKEKQVKSARSELQEHREALSSQQLAVSKLVQMLAEQEEKLGALESADETVAAQVCTLRREREDALADLALGNKRDADIAEIDRKISSAMGGYTDAQGAGEASDYLRAEQVVEGLRRRKAQAEQELERMEQLTPDIVRRFVIDEAAATYSSYLDNANKVIADMKRIAALDVIFGEVTGDNSYPFTAYQWRRTLLPMFNLPHDGEINAHDPASGRLFCSNSLYACGIGGLNELDQAVEAERERLRDSGIFDLN